MMEKKRRTCKELRKLEKLLRKRKINYLIIPTEDGAVYIDQIRFEKGGNQYSAINGMGTYGGYDFIRNKNLGYIELRKNHDQPVGYLTAKDVIERISRNDQRRNITREN